MSELLAAAESITRFLREQGIPHMVVGGLANLAWGQARLTEDVDVSIWYSSVDLDLFAQELTRAGFTVVPSDPAAFVAAARVLPLKAPNAVKIDLILAMLPLERTAIDRAVTMRFGSHEFDVCSAEDLIILKSVSTRAKDAEDIQGVIVRMGSRLDLAYLLPVLRELSRLLERADLIELCRELEGLPRGTK